MTSIANTKPCTRCHEVKPLSEFDRRPSARSGRRSACKECRRKANRQWKRENQEQVAAAAVVYGRANRERISEYKAEWRRANPFNAKAHAHNYRARQAGVPGQLSAKDLRARYRESHQRCHYCQTALNLSTFEIDHVVPLGRGGPNTTSNIVIACRACNTEKGNRTAREWEEARGR